MSNLTKEEFDSLYKIGQEGILTTDKEVGNRTFLKGSNILITDLQFPTIYVKIKHIFNYFIISLDYEDILITKI